MTDGTDSGQAAGTASSPNEAGSQSKGDSASSFDAAKLQSTLEALSHKLEEVDARSRALQGDKDRGVTKATKQVEELKAKIAEYEKLKGKGFDTDDALDEITFRDDIRQIKDQLDKFSPASQQATGTSPAGVTEAAKSVFEKAKLDPNTPEAVQLLRDYGNDPIELAMQAGLLRARVGNVEPPSPASAPAIQGGTPITVDVEAMSKELMGLYRFPSKNKDRIAKLEKELEAHLPK
jgi:hypothetical protein